MTMIRENGDTITSRRHALCGHDPRHERPARKTKAQLGETRIGEGKAKRLEQSKEMHYVEFQRYQGD